MLKVGVTGGIGSGKSLICRIFGTLGVPVYDADSRAKFLIENHPTVKHSIISLFGPESYTPEGGYNRGYIAGQVFGNSGLLTRLNSIVHPAVGLDFENWASRYVSEPYIIKEAALMSAAGKASGMDKVIVVTAPEDLRVERVRRRDRQRTEEEIRHIIASQKTEKEFSTIADFLIYNDETRLVIPQILTLHHHLLNPVSS